MYTSTDTRSNTFFSHLSEMARQMTTLHNKKNQRSGKYEERTFVRGHASDRCKLCIGKRQSTRCRSGCRLVSPCDDHGSTRRNAFIHIANIYKRLFGVLYVPSSGLYTHRVSCNVACLLPLSMRVR